jgi:hypothetical protein
MAETENDTTVELLQEIEKLQRGLKRLKLRVQRSRDTQRPKQQDTESFSRGEEVIIINPRPGQDKTGKIDKVHESGWITVIGSRTKAKIKRVAKNIRRKLD